jgi:hypothetical protein
MNKDKENMHIQYEICSHHVEYAHFRGKLYQQNFQVFLISHMLVVEESYYPSHHSQHLKVEI